MSVNPPAFPNNPQIQLGDDYQGMTLRDYFAAQAITICKKDHDKTYICWAQEAYALADAMLEAREVKP